MHGHSCWPCVGGGIAQSPPAPRCTAGEARRHGMHGASTGSWTSGRSTARRTDGRLDEILRSASQLASAAEHHPPAYKQLAIPPPAPVGPIGPAHQEPPTPWCSPTPAPWATTRRRQGHRSSIHMRPPGASMDEVVQLGAGGADPRSPSLLDLGAATPLAHRPQPRASPQPRQEPQRVGGHRLGAGRHGSEAEARTADANGLVNASPIGTEHDLRLPLPESSLHRTCGSPMSITTRCGLRS